MSILNFTKKALDTLPLPAAGKRAFYRDSAIPGLGIRVTSKGVKTFIVYRKVDGKPQRTTLGRYPATKIAQARKKAEQINGQIADGKNPNAEKRRAREEPTLGELYARYRDDYLIPHGKRTALAETHYQLHLKRWKGKKLSEIAPADVKALHARIGRTAGKPMANRVHQTLRAMLNWAIEEEHLEGSNPAKGVRRFTERSRERFLQPDEMPAFFKALADEPNETFRDFVLTALFTGARRGNVQAMRWEDVHLERATWEIPETKSGEPHTLPLSPEAVAVLRTRKERS
ncbi:MAG: site-specific integrase, partial [Gammaproteobacteria bacterium]|nr:site-specific integrase [Gammaproteobacteria bacterium]